MAIALIQPISPSSPVPSSAATDPAGPRAPAGAAADNPTTTPPPTGSAPAAPGALAAPAAARARALTVLRGLLTSPSTRVARDAALALARTCEPAARTQLASARAAETSELSRLAIDYTLARCADAPARQRLVSALTSARRDVKADAARALVNLGDDAGFGFLRTLLGVAQHRLGAAEALAPRRDPRALTVLTTVHADPRATSDDRLRAAIALTSAGDARLADTVRAALTDLRFRPAAAVALAQLGDPTAHDALVGGLAAPSLRVDAARALRRLAPDRDVTPLLPGLLAALDAERDASQASAAEALLILTGPATDAERP